MADTVTVLCALPQGLVLDLYGPRKEGITLPTPMRSITLKGGRAMRDANGMPINDRAIFGNAADGGVGMTENVPKEFWDAWYVAHKDSDLVASGLVSAVPTVKEAEKEARVLEDEKTGFEPIDPENPAPGIEKSDDVK